MLKNYIKNLYNIVEAENNKKEQVRRQEAASLQTMQPSVKGIEQQILELLRSLSSDQLSRPWTMAEFVMRLEGKYRDRPHPQQVAEILRKQGWKRRRIYGMGGGRRYWAKWNSK